MTGASGNCFVTASKAGDGTTYRASVSAPVTVAAVSSVFLCEGYISVPGTIHTFAGYGAPGFAGDAGLATLARLALPFGVAAGNGALFIADADNHRVRRVNLSTCTIETIAGTGVAGFSGDGGAAVNARLNTPRGVAVSGDTLYVADSNNHRVRQIDLTTGVITTVAGSGDFTFAGDGGAALAAGISGPFNVSVSGGSLFIADRGNHRVRRVDLLSGTITTVAGNGVATFGGDGGPATAASLSFPRGMAVVNGGLFVADSGNNRVRRVDLTSGIITTAAGDGSGGLGADGVPATTTSVWAPTGLASEGDGVIVAEENGHRVRRLDLVTGTITTLAGTGVAGASGDEGPGTAAELRNPGGVAVGPGAIYIADTHNHRVRRLDREAAAPNNPPVANDGVLSTSEDTVVNGSLAATDPDGDPLTFSIVSNGSLGSVAITDAAAGAFTYTPNANVSGTDAFTFIASDGTADANVATITVTVAPINDPPSASDGTLTTDEDVAAVGVLAGSDVDSASLTYSIVAAPTMGTVTITDPATGAYAYSPNANANGADSFTFRVSDAQADSNVATVSVTLVPVNDAPVVANVNLLTSYTAAVNTRLSATDIDSSSLTFAIVANGAIGTANVTNGNEFQYVPNPGASGTDFVTFKANDGSLDSNVATVTIDLVAVNLVTPNGGETVVVNMPSVIQWTATHTDTIDVELSRDAGLTWTPIAGCTGLAGTATSCTWTPTAPATTAARVQVTGTKQGRVARDLSAATFTIHQNQPPVASDGTLTTNEDTPGNGVLGASDDGPSLVFSIVAAPAKGSVSVINPATGTYVYTPNANANGADTFTFKADDGSLESNVATVSVTIVPVNDPPSAFNGSLSTNQNTPASGTLTAADIDGPTLTFSLTNSGTKGIAAISNAATGAFTYTPNDGATGPDAFTFQVSDGVALSNTATISVTINGVNRPPVVNGGVVTTNPSVGVTGTVDATDPDGDSMTFAIVTPPTQGLASLASTTGVFSYIPNGNASGYDSFTFTSSDGRGGTSTATQMFIVVAASPKWPGQTVKMSVASSGASANGGTYESAVSANGRVVAFGSPATNLVPNDTNNRVDVFVRDRQTNQTTRVSVSSSGAQTSGTAHIPAVSGDGRYVAFESSASNLVSGDTNGRSDIFLHDRQTGQTTRVSLSNAGGQGNSDSRGAQLNGDGRFIAFHSVASNLVSGADANGNAFDVFLRDRQTGTTTRVSRSSDGTQANNHTFVRGMSADARFVLMSSTATNLVSGDTNGAEDLFVHDRQTGQTTRVSVASDGTQANAEAQYPSMSADGRFVVLTSSATNLVAGDTNGTADVFIHDRQTGQTARVSIADDGTQGNGGSTQPKVSGDGRFVAFESSASNLVAGDTNGRADAFIHDRLTARTVRVNVTPAGGQSTATGGLPVRAFSSDGQFLAFGSAAADLVALDSGAPEDLFEVGGVSVTPSQSSFTAAGGNGTASVTFVYPGTPWSATSQVPWITVTSPTGTLSNNGTATYSVAPNSTPVPRIGTVMVAAQLVTVQQETAANPTVIVNVTSPNGGETVFASLSTTIQWTASGASSIDVALSRDGGTTFTPITGCVGLPGTTTSCSWTPSSPASSTARIRVTATDGAATVADTSDANFAISTVSPSINVTAPNTTVSWGVGSNQSITWNHTLGSGSLVRVELSRDAGTTWETLAASVQNTTFNTGTFAWTPVGPLTSNALIRVSWLGGSVSDTSNTTFSIAMPFITVTGPNTNNITWPIGSTGNIIWAHNLGPEESVRLEVSRDGGATWILIAASAQNDGINVAGFNWTVTGPPTTAGRIRATWLDDTSVQDVSDINFTIASGITVTSPNTSVSWAAGSRRAVMWNHNYPMNQFFSVEVSTNNGSSWTSVATGMYATSATTGMATIFMPNVLATQALVRVSPLESPGDGDTSDVPFTLAVPAITVTAPNTNVNWPIGTTRAITWSHNLGELESVQIEVSRDSGATWSAVTSVPNTAVTAGSFDWVVTGPVTNAARIRVTWPGNSAAQDMSDVNFRIPSNITVTSPNTSVTWAAASQRTVTWTHNYGLSQVFNVEVSSNNGVTWTAVAAGMLATSPTTGAATIFMPAAITPQALVRVSPFGNPIDGDVSDVPFTLASGAITVTAPNTNVSWPIGISGVITWSHNLGDLESVQIEISRDAGATWTVIASSIQNSATTTGAFNWVVAGPVTNAARIRATWTSNASIQDVSDVNFGVATGLTVTSPNTSVMWAAGSRRPITWNHNNYPLNQVFIVDVSTDNGATWTTVAGGQYATSSSAGAATIIMPNVLTTQARVRISPLGSPEDGDMSDMPFTLTPGTITVTAPNANMSWPIGSTRTITWSHNLGSIETVRIEVSRDAGATWQLVADNVANMNDVTGSFSWTVTGPNTSRARIRVTWTQNGTASDTSDVNFRIN
jgi:hypothetical protein